jgi:hypothetical protein
MVVFRWKKRFSQEEDARVEAEARSAYLEHQLLAGGREPFPTSNRSKPLNQDGGDATGESSARSGQPLMSPDAHSATLSETYTVIERQVGDWWFDRSWSDCVRLHGIGTRQVRRIQVLERQVQELLDANKSSAQPTSSVHRTSVKLGGRRGRSVGHAETSDSETDGANVIDMWEEEQADAPQFQSILRRLSIGPGSGGVVAHEFKPFALGIPLSLAEEDETGDDIDDGGDSGAMVADNNASCRLPAVTDEEHAVREAEAEFERRQSAMAKNIRDYGRTIVLKEERLKELEVRMLAVVVRCFGLLVPHALCSAVPRRGKKLSWKK